MTAASQPEYPVINLRPGHKPPETTTPEGTPEAPEWLSEYATEIWARLAPYYTLGPTDVDEFAAYMEALAEFREATEVIGEAGLLILDAASGMPVPNPISGVRDRADKKLAFWANRFRGV